MSKLAAHYLPVHHRNEDKEWIGRSSRNCLKLAYGGKPDVGHVREMCALVDLPNCTFVLRDVAMSEQKDDVRRDAVGTGQRHAKEWDETLRRLKGETPIAQAERVLITGINECPVWESPAPWVVYYSALMDTLREGFVASLNLSVGHPDNTGPGTPSNWQPYDPVLQRIDNSGRGHWIGLHEYWGMDHGPSFYGGWWAYRYRHLLAYRPGTPISLLEVAPTKEYQSQDGGWGLKSQDGWKGSISPETAYAQMCEYDDEISTDASVAYATPFTLDGAHPWIEEYDINPLIPIWNRTTTHWRAASDIQPPPVLASPPTTPVPVQPPSSDFERAVDWVLGQEGGYTPGLPGDPGGETNWGISKGAHPNLDIKNLTREQAKQIYRQEYWNGVGAPNYSWPMNLILFDSAVQHGVGRARSMLSAGTTPLAYMGERLRFYAQISHFDRFGRAWTRRMGDLLTEAEK